MSFSLRSKYKRPEALTDADYDHEIQLVDRIDSNVSRSRSRSTNSSSRGQINEPLRRKLSLRTELTKRKWKKYRDVHVAADEIEDSPIQVGSVITLPPKNENILDGDENRDQSPRRTKAQQQKDNLPTGSKLGMAWPEWIVNHDDGVDEEGWEYSFAFSKKWSWHNAKWYNSFVRRRVWIRKRVKKGSGYHSQHAHMLNDDYFTIHPARSRSRGTTLTAGGALDGDGRSRHSLAVSCRDFETEWRVENISNIATLMKVLRICRIDREKLEAMESFIKHGDEELHYLTEVEHMHNIMNHFIFQASRRVLLGRLMKEFEAVGAEGEAEKGRENERDGGGNYEDDNDKRSRRAKNLEAAVKAADEEVKRLEYWSDVRHMAEKGRDDGCSR
ncbi:hypothetical protein DID88_000859 [Monilinia fructigena]|uniref:Peroxin/Ferlin domain-containing protein n=1 Tax=Monilinia fructigena TaxID=38457 RepID=A0A395IYQ0_9HELO|nr:hypothetical protein DID88_000859 [Monilinia fructigena]